MPSSVANKTQPIVERDCFVARPDVPRLRPQRITTDWLMRGSREIVVQHGLEEYRLRITATGKLILTK